MTETRLYRESNLWTRWRPVRLVVEAVPLAGMMVAGGYVMAWSADSKENVGTPSPGEVTRLMSMSTSVTANLASRTSINIPMSTTQKWYLLDAEDSEEDHGVLLVACSGLTNLAEGSSVSIAFTLHWTIVFDSPAMQRAKEQIIISPEDGWGPVFTDSTSDWAEGKKLTFKHAEGGAVVPWSNLQAGMIYTPTSGVKITYKNAQSADVEAKWFSKCIDSAIYSSALVVHKDENSAKKYQETGALAYIVDFTAAGTVAVPSYPTLVGKPVQYGIIMRKPPRTLHTFVHTRDTHIEDDLESLASGFSNLGLNQSRRSSL